MGGLLEWVWTAVPSIVTVVGAVAVLILADRLLLRRGASLDVESKLVRQLILLVLTGVAVVLLVLTLPIAESTRNQLLALLGLVVTALLTLSSTTFVANAMAGVMLRSVNNFRPGDFVRVGEHFGRVTARGLFHTEVQSEDSDLTTLPNLLLVSNPVTVVRATGTIVSATVSLGYDNAHAAVEPILIAAASAAELDEPFVQVVDLGDHAVTYRVAGFLPDVKRLLTARSNLRRSVLDSLHGADIEIVSPSFMNQRALAPDARVLPHSTPVAAAKPPVADVDPEALVFDKAEAAEREEELRTLRESTKAEIEELEEQMKKADESEKGAYAGKLSSLRVRLEHAERELESK